MTLELIAAITVIILIGWAYYAKPRRVKSEKEDDSDIHMHI